MTIAQSVESWLQSHHVDYELIQHPHTASSMLTAQAAHITGSQLAKSVLLEDDSGYLMAIIPATHRVDLGLLHRQFHRRLGLAVEKEVNDVFFDCEPGAIPAIGPAYRIATIVDDSLLEQPDVYFEAGDHEALIHMSGPAFGAMVADLPHGPIAHHV